MDMRTVEGMLQRVKRFDFERCIFVCDRGMVSEANLKAIEKAEYGYLVGVKLRGLREVRDKVLCSKGRFQKVDNSLEVKEVILEGRRYIICRNPEEAEHDRHIREELVEKLSEALSASELALQYKHLFSVERAFRSLKSGINLRPFYHWTTNRIKAHVSLCVLYYFVQRYAELKTEKSWDVISKHMKRISATKILLKNGAMIKRSQLTNFQKLVLNQLDTEEPPLILGS